LTGGSDGNCTATSVPVRDQQAPTSTVPALRVRLDLLNLKRARGGPSTDKGVEGVAARACRSAAGRARCPLLRRAELGNALFRVSGMSPRQAGLALVRSRERGSTRASRL